MEGQGGNEIGKRKERLAGLKYDMGGGGDSQPGQAAPLRLESNISETAIVSALDTGNSNTRETGNGIWGISRNCVSDALSASRSGKFAEALSLAPFPPRSGFGTGADRHSCRRRSQISFPDGNGRREAIHI